MENTYKYDFDEGKWAEHKFAEAAIRELNAIDVIFNESNDKQELKKWDLAFTNTSGKIVTFEVKYDKKSTSTGNFAVEYSSRYAPSGIAATTADYWVTLSNNQFYIFVTAKLKQLIKNNNFRMLQIHNGTSWCYLVPIDEAQKISRIINL